MATFQMGENATLIWDLCYSVSSKSISPSIIVKTRINWKEKKKKQQQRDFTGVTNLLIK